MAKGLDPTAFVASPMFRMFWRAVLIRVETREQEWMRSARAASLDGKPFVCVAESARADAAARILEDLEAFLAEARETQEEPDERSEHEAGLEITEPGHETV